jgi:hypothetical protein
LRDPRSIAREEADDVGRFARMTPEERLAIFLELCRLTDSIVRNRPDVEALRALTPRSPESEALWRRLIEEARRERAGR